MLPQWDCQELLPQDEKFSLSGSPTGNDNAAEVERPCRQPAAGSREAALHQRAAATFDSDRRLAKVASCTPSGPGRLVEEDDDGDVEYKWRLTGVTPTRFEHLLTQMRFRVGEGNGQCLYELGIANNGAPRGLPMSDYRESVETLQAMAKALALDATILQEFVVRAAPVPLWCGEILLTRRQARPQDGRIAFCGAAGSGKSTLMGVLLTRRLDDGAGSARQSLFNHKHELSSGRTTSIVTRTIALGEGPEAAECSADQDDPNEGNKNHTKGEGGGSAETHGRAVVDAGDAATPFLSNRRGRTTRWLTVIDLGGDVSKRMLFGLVSRKPDFTGVCVSVGQPAEEVRRYAQVCCALRLLFFVVVTKLDTALDFEVDDFMLDVAAQLSSVGCDSVMLEETEDVERFLKSRRQPKLVPILSVSSTDGTGMDRFKHFLASVPLEAVPPTPVRTFEVQLDGSFHVRGVGPVVRGHVASGCVELGYKCSIGPDTEGKFYPVTIQGIHVDGSHVTRVQQTDEATFALSELPSSIDMSQKGKLLIPMSVDVAWELEARVRVLYSHGMTPHLQPILYAGNIRQAVRVVPPVSEEFVLWGREDTVRFRFLYHPEVLREGASIVLQWMPDGIAVGEVTSIFA